MAKLTENSIAGLSVKPGERDTMYWDSSLPGFGLRIYSSGKRAFICKFTLASGQQRKVSLGPALPGTLAETRKRAHEILSRARLGQDLIGERQAARERARKEAPTGALAERYLAIRAADVAAGEMARKSYIGVEYHLKTLAASLHDRAPETIRQRDISNLVDELAATKGRRTADVCRASLAAFFNWLAEKEYVAGNPCSGIKKRDKAGPRDRCLSPAELAEVWRATETPTDHHLITRLLLLTGARRDEIGALKWSEVDLTKRKIRLPKERVKAGRKTRKGHTIFLSEPAAAILANIARRPGKDFVFGRDQTSSFSGWSRAKLALDARLSEAMPEAWTLHDLRRTFSTLTMEHGFASTEVKEAALGHARKGVDAVYDHSEHTAARRALMARWADFVLAAAR